MMPGRLFCFGLGYTAMVLARRLRRHGWKIAGTTREDERCRMLAGEGIEAYRFDRAQPLADPAAALAGANYILLSVPPDAEGDPVLDLHGDDIAGLGGIRWLGYLSTTGVYGDRGGDWVDETSELRPSTERGARRVAAEQGWLNLGQRHGLPVHVFRLAGIYGPGRNQIESLKAGSARRIVKPGQVFSRIHVEDIATVLEASMAKPNPGATYNVCDDEAAAPQDVVAHAAGLLGIEPPPEIAFETADLSPMGRSFYAESKRCRNGRIKTELGVSLRYPSYREGLRALLDDQA